MKPFVFHNPTEIVFGPGMVDEVGARLANHRFTNVLLVTGQGSVRKSGLYDRVVSRLTEEGIGIVPLDGIAPNPQIDSVRAGVGLCRGHDIDAILAVGGGSVIDCAKGIAGGATYDGDPWDFYSKCGSPDNPLPVAVVLTVSATGAEMNGNTVVSNPKTHEKRATYHPGLFPCFSILDPELTYTVPADQTAYGAIDILSHVFEQYFHHATPSPLQDGFAETVMKTVIADAPIALATPDHPHARANLMWASSMALNGILGAGVSGDWASHVIGHELTAHYGIPHGVALAIIFPQWMRHVAKQNPSRFAQFAINVWGVDPAGKSEEVLVNAGIEAFESFCHRTLGVQTHLTDYAITDDRFDQMATSAQKYRQLGTFVPLEHEDIVAIYRAAR